MFCTASLSFSFLIAARVIILSSCNPVIILSSLCGLMGFAPLQTTQVCTTAHPGFAKAHSFPHRASHVLHNRPAAALFLLLLIIALVVSLLSGVVIGCVRVSSYSQSQRQIYAIQCWPIRSDTNVTN